MKLEWRLRILEESDQYPPGAGWGRRVARMGLGGDKGGGWGTGWKADWLSVLWTSVLCSGGSFASP